MSEPNSIAQATLLIVDDDESLRRVLEFQLSECGYRVIAVADAQAALDVIVGEEIACLITDVRLPGLSGLELLRRANAINSGLPIIVITAYGDVETAVEAMRAGAFDFITKPFNRDQIRLTVEKALAFGQKMAELARLRRLVHERFDLTNVIGDSPAMRRVLELVARVARSDVTVLLTGESGTGKELIARGIHFASARSRGPFIAVNCAAIPETLVESELFGHRRGAFTGATRDAKGKFEEASGGTLFLDEVSAMPLSVQGKLLRALQEHEIVRLGESSPRKIDVRIIAATNRDLQTMIADGAFREDLYYRLAVVPIELPPLRERREDIPLLVERFLQQACERHGRQPMRVAREVFAAFNAYAWPGNVRELKNTVERMVVLARGDVLSLEDVPDQIRRPLHHAANVLVQLPPEGISLEAVEREIIRQALLMHGGNQSRTARYLDITRSALIYRMQKYGLAEESVENNAAQTGEESR